MAYLNSKTYGGGAAQQTVTSNMIELTIAGTKIGRAQRASSEIQYGTQGVYEIGSIYPQEHVYTRYEGTLTLERVLLISQSLAEMHIAPLGEDVLGTGTVDVVMKDKDAGNKVIAAYIGCTATSYSTNVQVTSVVSETLNMTYLKAALVDQ